MVDRSITLTSEEMGALYALTNHVAGDPDKSRRGYIDKIRQKIAAFVNTKDVYNFGDVNGRLSFTDSQYIEARKEVERLQKEAQIISSKLVEARRNAGLL